MSRRRNLDHNGDSLAPNPKGTTIALRPSLEEAYKSSSEDEEYDELDLLQQQDEESQHRPRRRYRDEPSAATPPNQSNEKISPEAAEGIGARNRRRRCCAPTRLCALISGLIVAAFLIVLTIPSIWVWKHSPPDGQSPPWYPSPRGGTLQSWHTSYQKAEILVAKMSLMEKVNITTGVGWSQDLCVGNTAPATGVGFPGLCLQDGPLGIRFADHATAFPAGITVGATWNRTLMYARGRAHGYESRKKGVNVILGPAMGPLGRMPAGGRNWEGFGSDPVLQGVAAYETIRGIQDQGVIATAKHYVGNEQEHFRQSFEWGLPNAISSNIGDRTMHEVYLWPFADSVRAGVGSIMCSYNMVNNSYACGNSKLMNGILKDELGFQGFVQSDWLAQRSGVGSTLAGLDMTMPGDGLRWADGQSLWGPLLTASVLNGSVPLERIHDMAARVVAAWYQLGQDNKTLFPEEGPNFSSWTDEKVGRIHVGSDDKTNAVVNKFVNAQKESNGFSHATIARQVAAEGTVLVKNDDGILPLSRQGASSLIAGSKYRVGIFGEDAGPGDGPNACPDRGCNQGTLGSGWGSGAVEFPYLIDPLSAIQKAYDASKVEVSSFLSNTPGKTFNTSVIEESDLCLVFVNSDAGEGFIASDGIRGDRNDLYPQKGGDDLVKDVAKSCGKGEGLTVVIIHSVGPVVVERWVELSGVKAVVMANLPGEESGNALVDVLFGDVDVSGRLPYTVGKSLSDYGDGGQIMYYPNNVVPQQNFDEELYIDYRHFDKYNITPRYEFGFGMSYTTFEYTNLRLTTLKAKSAFPAARPADAHTPPPVDTNIPNPSTALFPPGFRKLAKRVYPYISSTSDVQQGRYAYPDGYQIAQPASQAGGAEGGNPDLYAVHLNVTFTIKNTGSRTGQDVPQIYVSFPTGVIDASTGEMVDFPVQVLRGFEKVEIKAEGSLDVTVGLTRKDLSYWSVGVQNWVMPVVENGFGISVGRSSRDLKLVGRW
ncbi:hypothetical protein MMC25_003989 [Agyrium rufum]|nr:hypothetical protein [Agyrium rufum]